MTTDTRTERPRSAEAAGEARLRLRAEGWRSDLAWSAVSSGSAPAAVRAAGGASARRTIAYVPALRALDGGAGKVWKEGDVPAPPEADAREVMRATAEGYDWESEVFEAPPEAVGSDASGDGSQEQTDRAA